MPTNLEILNAIRTAFDKGYLNIGLTNFEGWVEGCDCEKCVSQRIAYDFLYNQKEGVENDPATAKHK